MHRGTRFVAPFGRPYYLPDALDGASHHPPLCRPMMPHMTCSRHRLLTSIALQSKRFLQCVLAEALPVCGRLRKRLRFRFSSSPSGRHWLLNSWTTYSGRNSCIVSPGLRGPLLCWLVLVTKLNRRVHCVALVLTLWGIVFTNVSTRGNIGHAYLPGYWIVLVMVVSTFSSRVALSGRKSAFRSSTLLAI